MRAVFCVLALVLLGCVLAAPARCDGLVPGPGKVKVDPDRLKGIRAAVTDIEAGKLKLKSPALPVAAWNESYLELLKKECSVDWETVSDDSGRAELQGYNDVMILEIEHQFGKGILETLQKKAEANFRKSLEG